MTVLADRRVAGIAVVLATGTWAWIAWRGGFVARPPLKTDRPVHAAAAPRAAPFEPLAREPATPAQPPPSADPAALERRIAALDRVSTLDDSAVSRDLTAWSTSRAPAPPADLADDELATWLRAHPLGGTRVHGAQRIALFGGRVVREGDELDGAVARVTRIEPAGVVLERRGAPVRVPVASAASTAEPR